MKTKDPQTGFDRFALALEDLDNNRPENDQQGAPGFTEADESHRDDIGHHPDQLPLL